MNFRFQVRLELKTKKKYNNMFNRKVIGDEEQLISKKENQIVEKVDSIISYNNHLNSNVYIDETKDYVNIIDDLTKINQVFTIINDIYGEIHLLSNNGEKVGYVRPWCDNSIPNELGLTNKEGIVEDPNTKNELYEYIISNQKYSVLPKNIYREYRFLPNNQTLQQTNEIIRD